MKQVSFFPYILLALTLVLVTCFVFLTPPKQTENTNTLPKVVVVSEGQYQDALEAVLKKFFSVYDSAASDTARIEIVQNTLNSLLSMRVPVSFKDMHLELAIALQKMKQGFISNPQDVTDGYARLKELISQSSWLRL
jgi:hypothetical protein